MKKCLINYIIILILLSCTTNERINTANGIISKKPTEDIYLSNNNMPSANSNSYKQVLSILPFQYNDDQIADILSSTVSANINLNLRLTGKYNVTDNNIIESTYSSDTIKYFSSKNNIDTAVYGEITNETDIYKLTYYIYNTESDSVDHQNCFILESVLDIFDCADKITENILSNLIKTPLSYGTLNIIPNSDNISNYNFYINENLIPYIKRPIKLLTGEYNLKIKTISNKIILDTNISIIKNKTSDVSIPSDTKEVDAFVFVNGGTFIMGTNDFKDAKPEHNVTINDFYISKYEVTQSEYQDVIGKNPSHPTYGIGPTYPVNYITWFDAIFFCNSLSLMKGLNPCYSGSGINIKCDFSANGYRLPTEAEWEYAAHGGSKSKGHKYSGSNNINEVAWYNENSNSKSHPVGQKQPNELGLFDMSGNVWEWCWDYKGKYKAKNQNNPLGPKTGKFRVNRGGSWFDDDVIVLLTNRNRAYPTPNKYHYFPKEKYIYRGIRLVRSK